MPPTVPTRALTWIEGQHAVLTCRWCHYKGSGEAVAQFQSPLGSHMARRCPDCASLELLDDNLPSSPTDADVDEYIEVSCGLGSLAALVDIALRYATPREHSSFLDVGCNYGVALDYARWRTAWDVVGVEPSRAGERAREDFNLDVRVEALTNATGFEGRTFDVVMCSEVLEHVADPGELVRLMVKHLAPNGVLVITTPDATVVRPGPRQEDASSAISHGYHLSLATRAGLESILVAHGLAIEAVGRASVSHVVVARRALTAPAGAVELVEPTDLLDYLRNRAADFAVDTSPGVGLSSRAFRLAVAKGEFAAAHDLLPDLERRLRARYGRGMAEFAAVSPAPSIEGPFHGVMFSLGMLHLLEGKSHEAVVAFRAALSALERRLGVWSTLDLESQQLVWDTTFHLALALAHTDPEDAATAALKFEPEMPTRRRRFARVFVQLVNAGELRAAERLRDQVGAWLSRNAAPHDMDDITALDAMYALGALAAQRGDYDVATEWLERCIYETRSGDVSTHKQTLEQACAKILASFPPGRVG